MQVDHSYQTHRFSRRTLHYIEFEFWEVERRDVEIGLARKLNANDNINRAAFIEATKRMLLHGNTRMLQEIHDCDEANREFAKQMLAVGAFLEFPIPTDVNIRTNLYE